MKAMLSLMILSLASCSASNKESGGNNNTSDNYQKSMKDDKRIKDVENQISNNISSPPAQIGGANMDKDGTIHLHLSFQDSGGIGEGYFTYKKTDKDYKYILKHIGPIKPGQGKAVYAFPPDDPPVRQD